ncbi:MAG: hypothetical protein IJE81_07915 [Oscillospiraceae bacterium]|nr:hypothetical protein [Oscillospiraceae bacterium]
MKNNRFPFVLKTAALITAATTAVLTAVYCWLRLDWLLSCAISFGTTAYHFSMRLAVGYIIPKATNYHIDFYHPWFQPRSWESAFYKRLNIRNWKKHLPTYAPGQFSLEYNSLHRIIENMCGAEIVHEVIMVLSFLPLLTVPIFSAFPVFLVTSLLAALFDSIFVMAQRYNRPRLVRIYEKQEANVHE